MTTKCLKMWSEEGSNSGIEGPHMLLTQRLARNPEYHYLHKTDISLFQGLFPFYCEFAVNLCHLWLCSLFPFRSLWLVTVFGKPMRGLQCRRQKADAKFPIDGKTLSTDLAREKHVLLFL